MSERKSQFWLWLAILVIAIQTLKCDYHRFYQTRDLQRRVGQLESETR